MRCLIELAGGCEIWNPFAWNKLPRMADFARWVVATEVFERDDFLEALGRAHKPRLSRLLPTTIPS